MQRATLCVVHKLLTGKFLKRYTPGPVVRGLNISSDGTVATGYATHPPGQAAVNRGVLNLLTNTQEEVQFEVLEVSQYAVSGEKALIILFDCLARKKIPSCCCNGCCQA